MGVWGCKECPRWVFGVVRSVYGGCFFGCKVGVCLEERSGVPRIQNNNLYSFSSWRKCRTNYEIYNVLIFILA